MVRDWIRRGSVGSAGSGVGRREREREMGLIGVVYERFEREREAKGG